MKKMNLFFFAEEQIHWSDACWFYGVMTLCIVVTAVIVG